MVLSTMSCIHLPWAARVQALLVKVCSLLCSRAALQNLSSILEKTGAGEIKEKGKKGLLRCCRMKAEMGLGKLKMRQQELYPYASMPTLIL